MYKIKKVETKQDRKRFIDFPHDLYKGNKNYVPEIYMNQKVIQNPEKNPYFEHAKLCQYIVLKDNKVVGRIGMVNDKFYKEYKGENAGTFGYFDCIEDYKVAELLFDKLKEWSTEQKKDVIYGPMNYSLNEFGGLLIDSFDKTPVILMPYNKPYYQEYFEKYGFEKKKDMYSFMCTDSTKNHPSINILKERLEKQGIKLRNLNMKDFKNEIITFKELYNKTIGDLWGVIPITDHEILHTASDMKAMIDPKYFFYAEHKDKVIGYCAGVPDANPLLKKLKRGRLFPFGFLNLIGLKNKAEGIRVPAFGVLPEYRNMGIEFLMAARIYNNAFNAGKKKYIEGSWIWEDNRLIQALMLKAGFTIDKNYRLYEYQLN